MYEGWTREELIGKIRQLEWEMDKLKGKIRQLDDDNYSLRLKIEQELEPRIRAEKRSYDAWVTNAERGMDFEFD